MSSWAPRTSRLLSSVRFEMEAELRNRLARRPIVQSGVKAPVVSLTTYGERLNRVHLTIESIGAGFLRPSRLILWVDDTDFLAKPSRGVRRLMTRGLEVRATPDWGPHKKYYPYVAGTDIFRVPLVTADDDVYYPRSWLESLHVEHLRHPNDVLALRARLISASASELAPYVSWGRAPAGLASARVFPTGVGGVLYPVEMQQALKTAGSEFLNCAPRADDVWLHAATLRQGRRARQVFDGGDASIIPVRGAGVSGLWESNVSQSGNDRQIAATYSPEELALLCAERLESSD